MRVLMLLEVVTPTSKPVTQRETETQIHTQVSVQVCLKRIYMQRCCSLEMFQSVSERSENDGADTVRGRTQEEERKFKFTAQERFSCGVHSVLLLRFDFD